MTKEFCIVLGVFVAVVGGTIAGLSYLAQDFSKACQARGGVALYVRSERYCVDPKVFK